MKNKAINIFISVSVTALFLLTIFASRNDLVFYFLIGTLIFLLFGSTRGGKSPAENLPMFLFIAAVDCIAVLISVLQPDVNAVFINDGGKITGRHVLNVLFTFHMDQLKILGYVIAVSFVVFIITNIIKNKTLTLFSAFFYCTAASVFLALYFRAAAAGLFVFITAISVTAAFFARKNQQKGKKNIAMLGGMLFLHGALLALYIFFGDAINLRISSFAASAIRFLLYDWVAAIILLAVSASACVYFAAKNKTILQNILITVFFILLYARIVFAWNPNAVVLVCFLLCSTAVSMLWTVRRSFGIRSRFRAAMAHAGLEAGVNALILLVYGLVLFVTDNMEFLLANIAGWLLTFALVASAVLSCLFFCRSRDDKKGPFLYRAVVLLLCVLTLRVAVHRQFDVYTVILLVLITACLCIRSRSVLWAAEAKIKHPCYKVFLSLLTLTVYVCIALPVLFLPD